MNDSIVTPENTKLIAKWMGKSNISIYKSHVRYSESIGLGSSGMLHHSYNPITNAEQSREIEKKLFCMGYEILKLENFWHTYRGGIKYIRAETLELLIYNVALYEAKI